MRDLVVFLFVMAMMPTAFRRPYIGMLLFSWLAYMRPQDLCWGCLLYTSDAADEV